VGSPTLQTETSRSHRPPTDLEETRSGRFPESLGVIDSSSRGPRSSLRAQSWDPQA